MLSNAYTKVAAVALLYATTIGMTVTINGLRTTVDPNRATWYELSQNWFALSSRCDY